MRYLLLSLSLVLAPTVVAAPAPLPRTFKTSASLRYLIGEIVLAKWPGDDHVYRCRVMFAGRDAHGEPFYLVADWEREWEAHWYAREIYLRKP